MQHERGEGRQRQEKAQIKFWRALLQPCKASAFSKGRTTARETRGARNRASTERSTWAATRVIMQASRRCPQESTQQTPERGRLLLDVEGPFWIWGSDKSGTKKDLEWQSSDEHSHEQSRAHHAKMWGFEARKGQKVRKKLTRTSQRTLPRNFIAAIHSAPPNEGIFRRRRSVQNKEKAGGDRFWNPIFPFSRSECRWGETGKPQWGLSKRGLGPKGANLAKSAFLRSLLLCSEPIVGKGMRRSTF